MFLPRGIRRTSTTSPQGQIVFSNCLELYHTSPDSGERQYKSGVWKRRYGPAPRAGGRLQSPDGGLRPFHQKSTCIKQLTLGICVVQMLARGGHVPLTIEGKETFAIHRAEGESPRDCSPKGSSAAPVPARQGFPPAFPDPRCRVQGSGFRVLASGIWTQDCKVGVINQSSINNQ